MGGKLAQSYFIALGNKEIKANNQNICTESCPSAVSQKAPAREPKVVGMANLEEKPTLSISILFGYLVPVSSKLSYLSKSPTYWWGAGQRSSGRIWQSSDSLTLLTLGKTSGYTHHLSSFFVIVLFGLCFNQPPY